MQQNHIQKKEFDLLTDQGAEGVCVRTEYYMCLHGALRSIPFNLKSVMTTYRKKMFCPFDPTPGDQGVCKGRICPCMVFCAPFPLILFAARLLSEKNVFDLLTQPQGQRASERTNYVLVW